MKDAPYHVLRVGVAITFLWIGVLIFKSPEGWGAFLQPWVVALMPIPVKAAMIDTAILDIIIGGLLLTDTLVWLAALAGAIHLAIVLAVTGITDVTVRDIGLLAALIALFLCRRRESNPHEHYTH